MGLRKKPHVRDQLKPGTAIAGRDRRVPGANSLHPLVELAFPLLGNFSRLNER